MAQEKKKTPVKEKEEKGVSSKKKVDTKTTSHNSSVAKQETKESVKVEEHTKKENVSSSKATKERPVEKSFSKEKKEVVIEQEEKSSAGKVVIALLIIVILAMLLIRACRGEGKEYVITFDTNGGSTMNAMVVKENGKLEKPEDPTREGYIFDGWYYKGELFDFDTEITEDIKLEARWSLVGTEPVTGVTVEPDQLTLAPGSTAILEAVVSPSNAKDKSLTWTSSDSNVVTVDENGNIKALKEGKATITVTTTDGGFTATTEVTVSKDIVAVTGVSFDRTSIDVPYGTTYTLKADIEPSNATNKNLIWKSSNTDIVTVNKGVITAKKVGTATVTVTTSDGGYTATITVRVTHVSTTGVSISGNREVVVNGTIRLTANISPANATNKSVSWSVSDPSIATIDKNGTVRGIKEGEVTVTVVTKDGNKKATYQVKVVKQGATSVSISGASEAYVGETIKLSATVKPSTAVDKTVTWSVDNESIASIDQTGKLTAKQKGTVVVTARTANGKTATKTITIKEHEYEVTIVALENKIDGSIRDARVEVTKDGKPFEGWKSMTLYYSGSSKYLTKGNYLREFNDKTFTRISITLENGQTVETSTIKRKTEELQQNN